MVSMAYPSSSSMASGLLAADRPEMSTYRCVFSPPLSWTDLLTYDQSSLHTIQVFKKLASCKGFINNTCSPESTAKALSAKIVA